MSKNVSRIRCVGVLTSGGDCPGLNAAIRGITKAAIQEYGIQVIGIHDGFRGLVEKRTTQLSSRHVSGVLTQGGTILGTSRDKPRKMLMGSQVLDMTEVAVENARHLGLDCLVCLGGGGTQKNAYHLAEVGGLDVLTLPKTIDNDVAETDISFGFDTAMSIAVEAIDRLHTTATSHDRIIVVELMGHKAGWLSLGAGIAGGADVILIPEIPYDIDAVRDYLLERQRRFGKKFSIVVVAEGARSREQAAELEARPKKKNRAEEEGGPGAAGQEPAPKGSDADADASPWGMQLVQESVAGSLARQLQTLTRTETRVTSLGHVQRGGVPTATDRLLCTRFGVKAADLLAAGRLNVMVALQGTEIVPVDLKDVAGKRKLVPLDHPWIAAARKVGTCLGVAESELPD